MAVRTDSTDRTGAPGGWFGPPASLGRHCVPVRGISRGRGTLAASIGLVLVALSLGACGNATSAPTTLGDGTWGSGDAVLDISGSTGMLRIFNSGSCYGVFGEIDESMPVGPFDLPGTLTQLTNLPPGHVDFTAEFTGTVSGRDLSITVTVPSTQESYGPYVLQRGVTRAGGACAYP